MSSLGNNFSLARHHGQGLIAILSAGNKTGKMTWSGQAPPYYRLVGGWLVGWWADLGLHMVEHFHTVRKLESTRV